MRNLKTYLAAYVLVLHFASALQGQINQDHPELCGNDMLGSQQLPVVSASINPSNGVATLTLQLDGSPKEVELLGAHDEIRQVCPVPHGRLVVFGWAGAYAVNIVDGKNGQILDAFLAYDPKISPDQSWLIMRRFYSFQTEFVVSQEYAIYDLRPRADSKRPGVSRIMTAVGSTVYPVVPDSRRSYVLDVPESETHQFRSKGFYWTADSRTAVFADEVKNRLSIVLVRFEGRKATAYMRPISAREVCGIETPSGESLPETRLTNAEIDTAGNISPIMIATFRSVNSNCNTQPLTIRLDEFRTAPSESYPARERKPAIVISKP
jgi:hypothetical protein